MDNADIAYIFERGLVNDALSLDYHNIALIELMKEINEKARLKRMPICLFYSQPETSLDISFEYPITFKRVFEQLATALDWVMLYKVERRAVYVALFPRISSEFRDAPATFKAMQMRQEGKQDA